MKTIIQKHYREAIFAAFILLCVAYGIRSRTLPDFVQYAGDIAIFCAIVVYGFLITQWAINGHPRYRPKLFVAIFFYLPVGIFLISIIYYGLWASLKDGYIWLHSSTPPRPFAMFLAAAGTLALGYLLFLFRLTARCVYGFTEAVVGILVAVQRVPLGMSDPVAWQSDIYIAMLTAGVYLVVRGFDNMHTGLQPGSHDELIQGYKDYRTKLYSRFEQAKTTEPAEPPQ